MLVIALGYLGTEVVSVANPFDYLTPVLSTGIVGVLFLMVLFRIKIMPTYVYEDAKREWERERADKDATIAELKKAVSDANTVYTDRVIPTLTRILDSEQELVEIRRAEQYNRAGGTHE